MARRRRATRDKSKTHGSTAGDSASRKVGRRQLRAAVESLEVTRGHDGLLRGKPEPALVLAVYRVTPATKTTALVARHIQDVPALPALPCVLSIEGSELRYASSVREDERFVLVALAVERDASSGVTALYERLESPSAFELWSSVELVPRPRSLCEWTATPSSAPEAHSVQLLIGAEHARDLCRGDEFISACALSVLARERQDEIWRLRFSDDSEKNLWTATLRLRIA